MTIKSGIYAITNTKSDKAYIGSTIDFKRRWRGHRRELRRGSHVNPHLQASWNKHGEGIFKFDVLEYISNPNDLVRAEQSWMDKYREERKELYNVGLAAICPMRGQKFSKEHKKKIGDSNRGKTRKPFSKETRYNMSRGQMGNQNARGCTRSEAWKQGASKRMKGNKYGLGHIQPVTEESRRNISKSALARWAKVREETGK